MREFTKDDLTLRSMLERFVTNGPLNEEQELWLTMHERGDRIIGMSSDRGVGKTTFGIGFVAINSILESNSASMVMCPKLEPAIELGREIGLILDSVFTWFETEPMIAARNKREIRLNNGSHIHFSCQSPYVFRGRSLNYVFLDFDCDTIANVDQETMRCIVPSLYAHGNSRLLVSL